MNKSVAILLLVIAIVIILLIPLLSRSEPQPISCMPDDEMREKIRALMLEALDEGFRDHITKVFSIWVADPRDQPRRAAVGSRNAIRAYVGARDFVLKWNPSRCPS